MADWTPDNYEPYPLNARALIDAETILDSIAAIEQIVRETDDQDWLGIRATQYRRLMREWWNLPSRECMHVLYSSTSAPRRSPRLNDPKYPIRLRLLTSTHDLSERAQQPFVRMTPKYAAERTVQQKVRSVILRLKGDAQ